MTFKTEAEMVARFLEISAGDKYWDFKDWTVYPESCGWDLLLVHRDGYQLGIEAKLSLNPKVIEQALIGQHRYYGEDGPDYRAVMVPANKVQKHMEYICDAIGVGIIRITEHGEPQRSSISFPDQHMRYTMHKWHNWCPSVRCKLPEYIPDVMAGIASPIQLTPWKIKAIKLMILLERNGSVSRADMKKLEISPSRWTDCYHGFLKIGCNGRYIRNQRTPDFKSQHPENWVQIERDFDLWGKDFADPSEQPALI